MEPPSSTTNHTTAATTSANTMISNMVRKMRKPRPSWLDSSSSRWSYKPVSASASLGAELACWLARAWLKAPQLGTTSFSNSSWVETISGVRCTTGGLGLAGLMMVSSPVLVSTSRTPLATEGARTIGRRAGVSLAAGAGVGAGWALLPSSERRRMGAGSACPGVG